MKRKIGCLRAALISALILVIFVYGFHPWFHPGITINKLEKPNPTTFGFKASVDEIHAGLQNKSCSVAEQLLGSLKT
jgi:hypothetical protein